MRLSNNLISKIEDIKCLNKLDISYLDLNSNPITHIDNYRDNVFKIFPNLNVLDGIDKDGQIVESEIGIFFIIFFLEEEDEEYDEDEECEDDDFIDENDEDLDDDNEDDNKPNHKKRRIN